MKTIWAHTLVKNEERYLWFSVASVVNFVDKVLIWDTGSTDKTVEIITQLQKKYPGKIEFKETGGAGRVRLAQLRQEMLDASDCDWILVLDGDEVWWEDSIRKLIATILVKGGDLHSIVTPYVSMVGDIYHRRSDLTGRYEIGEHTGHINLRAINRKTPGLHVEKPYGKEGYFNDQSVALQDESPERREFINAPYMHFSHLRRSNRVNVIDRLKKYKHEIGEPLPLDYYYPEVFFRPGPLLASDIWRPMSFSFKLHSYLETPFKMIKRNIAPRDVATK